MKKTGYEIYPPAALGLVGIAVAQSPPTRHPCLGCAGRGLCGCTGWLRVDSRSRFSTRVVWEASPLPQAPAAVTGALASPSTCPGVSWSTCGSCSCRSCRSWASCSHQDGRSIRSMCNGDGRHLVGTRSISRAGSTAVIVFAMIAIGLLALATAVRNCVIRAPGEVLRAGGHRAVPGLRLVAVEAAFFDPTGGRTVVAEQGRYIFPAITALAAIAVGGTFGFGRRWQMPLATVLVVAMIGPVLRLAAAHAWAASSRRRGVLGGSVALACVCRNCSCAYDHGPCADGGCGGERSECGDREAVVVLGGQYRSYEQHDARR